LTHILSTSRSGRRAARVHVFGVWLHVIGLDTVDPKIVGARPTHSMSVSAYDDFRLDLQHIALSGNHLVQHRIDEKSDEEAGNETGHDDDGERPLRIRSNAGGKRGRQ